MRHRMALCASMGVLLLAAGCAATYDISASFRPPSGVSAKTTPKVDVTKIRRIGVIPFRNESGVPNAGRQVAEIFYEGLVPARQYEVSPPPKIDEDQAAELEFRIRSRGDSGVRNEEQDNKWLQERINSFVSTVQPYVTNLDLVYPGEYFEGKVESGPKRGDKGIVAESQAGGGDDPSEDAFLTGVVTSFRNRSGNAIIGEKGPHVTYTAYLVSAKDGSIIWQATFNEEQIYLLDNLLLLPRYAEHGFLWQTNEQLARSGLSRVLDTFPGLREKIEEAPPVREGS